MKKLKIRCFLFLRSFCRASQMLREWSTSSRVKTYFLWIWTLSLKKAILAIILLDCSPKGNTMWLKGSTLKRDGWLRTCGKGSSILRNTLVCTTLKRDSLFQLTILWPQRTQSMVWPMHFRLPTDSFVWMKCLSKESRQRDTSMFKIWLMVSLTQLIFKPSYQLNTLLKTLKKGSNQL